jgi:sterol desaturase/sphingolipid hydroxylase (fatty acid hydroxylase superfamily)
VAQEFFRWLTLMIAEDTLLRPAVFCVLLVLFASLESLFPRKSRTQKRLRRWFGNLGVLVVGTALTRIILPLAPVAAAIWGQGLGIGILNSVNIPILISAALTFVLLDLLIYGQHRLFHSVPLLWRLHGMHHTDMDLDVTSGLRFHPLEILLSLAIKILAVCALGAPPVAVLIFEMVLNGTSMFNHSNLRIPIRLDAVLRLFVVTPDMHRVHHSIIHNETNSNFGFNIPIWDRIFRTYLSAPSKGHDGMTIGLPVFRDERSIKLTGLLVQPFVDSSSPESKKGDG